jgi:hypothetical protein
MQHVTALNLGFARSYGFQLLSGLVGVDQS